MTQQKRFIGILSLIQLLFPGSLAFAAEGNGQILPPDPHAICRTALVADPHWSEPLAPRFNDAAPQVRSLLKRYGRAMEMGYFKRHALMAVVNEPENRQYFNAKLAPLLFQREPTQLTAGLVTEKLFELFIAAELVRLGPKTWRDRWRGITDFSKHMASRSADFVKQGVIGTTMGVIIAAAISPAWQQPVSEFQSVMYRVTPDFMRPDEIIEASTPREVHAPSTEASDFYTRIWRQANEGVPLNHQVGRSYYFEAEDLLLALDGNARILIMTRPGPGHGAGATEEDLILWRDSLAALRVDVARQPDLFPDVYYTDYARDHIEPRRLRLLALVDGVLGIAPSAP